MSQRPFACFFSVWTNNGSNKISQECPKCIRVIIVLLNQLVTRILFVQDDWIDSKLFPVFQIIPSWLPLLQVLFILNKTVRITLLWAPCGQHYLVQILSDFSPLMHQYYIDFISPKSRTKLKNNIWERNKKIYNDNICQNRVHKDCKDNKNITIRHTF